MQAELDKIKRAKRRRGVKCMNIYEMQEKCDAYTVAMAEFIMRQNQVNQLDGQKDVIVAQLETAKANKQAALDVVQGLKQAIIALE
jgi:hypothetical protein